MTEIQVNPQDARRLLPCNAGTTSWLGNVEKIEMAVRTTARILRILNEKGRIKRGRIQSSEEIHQLQDHLQISTFHQAGKMQYSTIATAFLAGVVSVQGKLTVLFVGDH